MKLKINNLRNLDFEEYFDVKPLNVIVGSNSSGKSTFLRFFPLIKQSIEKLTSSPILWYGPYVDYGSFKESINRLDTSGSINLSFRTSMNEIIVNGLIDTLMPLGFESDVFFRRQSKSRMNHTEFQFDISIIEDQIRSVVISYDDNHVEIVMDKIDQAIIVNGRTVFNSDHIIFESNANFQKILNVRVAINTKSKLITDLLEKGKENSSKNGLRYRNVMMQVACELITDALKNVAHKKIKRHSIREVSENLIILDPMNLKKDLVQYAKHSRKLPSLMESLFENKNGVLDSVFGIILASNVNQLIDIMNQCLSEYFKNVDYIAPLRAHAERYYRYQNLSVETIDPSGENIPTLINSLSVEERNRLNNWLEKHFDFTIINKRLEGHNIISICDHRTGTISNIKDTGFGFSQILPILIQLWMYTRLENNIRKSSKLYDYVILLNNSEQQQLSKTLIIEQPELHLHPALQARLIDSICEIIGYSKEKGLDVSFILETHSETIVNRVHRNIMKGKLKSDYANVTMFEQDANGTSRLRQSKINQNGDVENWPFGFFQPEV